MKYYLIVGEASGELHASRLMAALKKKDPAAQFRFIGGDLMSAVGGERVRHYREMAYMGFVPVLLHLRVIFRNMAMVKRDIVAWQPDVVILVDYAGFNLNIAHFLRQHTHIPVFFYISPKIWAWKEWRIKNIRRDVDEMFCILPFEVDFYEKKHHYPVHYVGNPTADEVRQFRKEYKEDFPQFARRWKLDEEKPVIALLAGSRKQEIKDNLPAMVKAASSFAENYQLVLACAPSVEREYYDHVLNRCNGSDIIRRVDNETYPLLSHSTAALVTSGTATLETALFGVPQVVCYKTPVPHIIRFCFEHIIQCDYISLVNLIADQEVVPELLADRFSVKNIYNCLRDILPGQPERDRQLQLYQEVWRRLGDDVAPDNAAEIMLSCLNRTTS
ncbi:MAG: lipid-A-disaccharide synthase [Prevotella sp.]|jgi:lipid-A-disaccharide synthase